MTNPPSPFSSSCRFAAILGASALFATLAYSSEKGGREQQSGVSLSSCEDGSEYVMVFGKVGEPFDCQLDFQVQSQCVAGYGASGEKCLPPKGIELDIQQGRLHGVPQKSGFHEFVVLVSEKGRTYERVLLIDIQESGINPMLDFYASAYAAVVR